MFTVDDPLSINLAEIQYRLEGLNNKQREILSLLVRGNDRKAITRILSISESMYTFQVANAIEHTGAKDRASLLIWYSVWPYAQRHPSDFQKDVGPVAEGER